MNGHEMSNKSRLTLEKRHQLIDLNKEYVNFDITFECRSVDATKDFEVVVVNQEQLNTIDITNLTMKLTKNGYISGNIVADEDKYQNYFLILRAPEEPLDVDLDIRIRPIDPKAVEVQPQEQQPIPHPSPPYAGDPLLPCQTSVSASVSPMPTTHLVLIVVGLLIIGGAVGYYLWKNKNKDHVEYHPSSPDASDNASDTSSVSSVYSDNILKGLAQNN